MSKPSHPRDLVHDVGRRVAELRALRGLTQEAMGERMRIPAKNAQRIESGRQNLTLKTMENVAKVLDLDPLEFLRLPGSGLGEGQGVPADWRASLEGSGLAVVGAGSGPAPSGTVPAYTVEGAAAMLTGQAVSPIAWVGIPSRKTGRKRTAGLFVLRAPDASMETTIQGGSWGLFRHPVEGELEGRVLFVTKSREGAAPAGLIRRIGRFQVDRQARLAMRLEADKRERGGGDDVLMFQDSWVTVPAAELVRVFKSRG